MGYSARYHAASLAAVFLALAIGILIGAGLGGSVLSDTEENLRQSLEGDIDEARGRSDDLAQDLDREREFGERAYPALVNARLEGEKIGIVALGDLPSGLSEDIERALEPTGAELTQIAVVRTPPDVPGLASALGRPAAFEKDPDRLEEVANGLGAQLAHGRGKQLARTRDVLLARSSGRGGRLDRVILVRVPPGDEGDEEASTRRALESGIVKGAADSGVPAVAVERIGDESSVSFFASQDLSTVDDIDLISGKVAMVFALLGANGDFGVKDTANRLLPELLVPSGG